VSCQCRILTRTRTRVGHDKGLECPCFIGQEPTSGGWTMTVRSERVINGLMSLGCRGSFSDSFTYPGWWHSCLTDPRNILYPKNFCTFFHHWKTDPTSSLLPDHKGYECCNWPCRLPCPLNLQLGVHVFNSLSDSIF